MMCGVCTVIKFLVSLLTFSLLLMIFFRQFEFIYFLIKQKSTPTLKIFLSLFKSI